MYSEAELAPFTKLVKTIEDIVLKREIEDAYIHRESVEEILFSILDGKDILSPYERRSAGIDDYQWKMLIKDALQFFNLRKSYEKIYRK